MCGQLEGNKHLGDSILRILDIVSGKMGLDIIEQKVSNMRGEPSVVVVVTSDSDIHGATVSMIS